MRGRGGVKSRLCAKAAAYRATRLFRRSDHPGPPVLYQRFSRVRTGRAPAPLHLLRREVQVRAAIFLVLDGLPVIEEAAASAASSRSSSMTCRPRHPQKEIL